MLLFSLVFTTLFFFIGSSAGSDLRMLFKIDVPRGVKKTYILMCVAKLFLALIVAFYVMPAVRLMIFS